MINANALRMSKKGGTCQPSDVVASGVKALIPELTWAVPADLNEIMHIFRLYLETRHKRRDYILKMILDGNVIFQDGVVWILCQTKIKVKWGNNINGVVLNKGDIADHGIASKNPGNGAAVYIASILFKKLDELRLPYWVSMRASNSRCISFMLKNGAVVVGDIMWSHGKIDGKIMCRNVLI